MNTNLISVMCDCSLPSFFSSPLCAGHGQKAQLAQCLNPNTFFSLQFWQPEDKIQLRCTLNFPVFERKSYYVAHTNLNLMILLPPVPKCWGYRCAPIPFPKHQPPHLIQQSNLALPASSVLHTPVLLPFLCLLSWRETSHDRATHGLFPNFSVHCFLLSCCFVTVQILDCI